MPDDKAVGIVVVVALTLFASLLYGYVGAISAGVYAISGGAAAEGNPAETNEIMLITLPFTLMAMYAFLLSILILRVNSKIVWFAAIAFWVANAIFWVQLVLGWGNFWEADLLQLHLTLLRVPSLYSLTCTGILQDPSRQATLQPSTEHQTRIIISPSGHTATFNRKETSRKKR